MIHLATGLLVHDGRLLMVASRYANHREALWNLPGGRQLPGELLAETVVREVLEETGLAVEPREVAYVSESYDGETHFLNCTFIISLTSFDSAPFDKLRAPAQPFDSAPTAPAQPFDSAPAAPAQDDKNERDHTVEVAWVPLEQVAERIVVRVVREPLIAYLDGKLPHRYAGYHDAGVTIEWPEGSA